MRCLASDRAEWILRWKMDFPLFLFLRSLAGHAEGLSFLAKTFFQRKEVGEAHHIVYSQFMIVIVIAHDGAMIGVIVIEAKAVEELVGEHGFETIGLVRDRAADIDLTAREVAGIVRIGFAAGVAASKSCIGNGDFDGAFFRKVFGKGGVEWRRLRSQTLDGTIGQADKRGVHLIDILEDLIHHCDSWGGVSQLGEGVFWGEAFHDGKGGEEVFCFKLYPKSGIGSCDRPAIAHD